MSRKDVTNVPASVHARLLNKARAEKRPFNACAPISRSSRWRFRFPIRLSKNACETSI